nr:immunoglobulin light chain junction region [Macaca mulatta]MPO02755.1 immunoglobulin light chain junction region [Macaca mulatta]
CQQESSWPTF